MSIAEFTSPAAMPLTGVRRTLDYHSPALLVALLIMLIGAIGNAALTAYIPVLTRERQWSPATMALPAFMATCFL